MKWIKISKVVGSNGAQSNEIAVFFELKDCLHMVQRAVSLLSPVGAALANEPNLNQ
jgi:hypothetical protein